MADSEAGDVRAVTSRARVPGVADGTGVRASTRVAYAVSPSSTATRASRGPMAAAPGARARSAARTATDATSSGTLSSRASRVAAFMA